MRAQAEDSSLGLEIHVLGPLLTGLVTLGKSLHVSGFPECQGQFHVRVLENGTRGVENWVEPKALGAEALGG